LPAINLNFPQIRRRYAKPGKSQRTWPTSELQVTESHTSDPTITQLSSVVSNPLFSPGDICSIYRYFWPGPKQKINLPYDKEPREQQPKKTPIEMKTASQGMGKLSKLANRTVPASTPPTPWTPRTGPALLQ